MKKRILLLTVFLYSFAYGQNNLKKDSTTIVTPEGFGRCLSELLINRGDIKDSPIAININTLLPNEDFSKYEDSPANFILSILKGYEILLTKSWDRLSFNADKFKIDKNSNYVKTFFYKTHKDKYKCVSVLQNGAKFYALNFEVLSWKKDSSYVIRVNDQLFEYRTIERLLKDYLKKLFVLEDMNTNAYSEKNVYQYNNQISVKISNKTIPSFNTFIDEFTHALTESHTYDNFYSDQANINVKELDRHWTKLISFFKENECVDLNCNETSFDNISLDDTNLYNMVLFFKFTSKEKNYKFTCSGKLVAGNWKLTEISSIEEVPEFQLQF